MKLFIDIVMKRIYLFNILAWHYGKKMGFPVCKKENFAGLQAHRKRGKSARASPTLHHTLNEERSARFTAQHLSALLVTEGARGKARHFFFCAFTRRACLVLLARFALTFARLKNAKKSHLLCWLFCGPLGDLVAPKRDRMFTGEILLRERIFSGKSDACNWIASGPRSVKQVLRSIPVLKISFQLTAFLPPRMFEWMVIHCFGATSREMCLVHQFATNFL